MTRQFGLLLFALCLFAAPAAGMASGSFEAEDLFPSVSQSDTSRVRWERYSTLHSVVKKTFLRIDALKIVVRLDEPAARAIHPLVRDDAKYSRRLADSVAKEILAARGADIDLEFLISVSVERFVRESLESIRAAGEAGLLSEEDTRRISAEQPGRFAFLRERGFKKGDKMFYEVRADTVRMRFVDREGTLLLEEAEEDSARRVSLLGAYFGPGSDFRERLIRSLFRN